MGKVFKNGLSKMWKTVFKKVEVIWPAETDQTDCLPQILLSPLAQIFSSQCNLIH